METFLMGHYSVYPKGQVEKLFRRTSLVAQRVKHLSAMQETQVQSLGWEDPLETEMATTPVILPEKSKTQRKLAGYSPWGCQESESDTIE